MELQAAFDSWLHTECGLTFQEVTQLTPQELARLQLGWVIRNRPEEARAGRSGATSRKQELERGQREARNKMYQDLGIH